MHRGLRIVAAVSHRAGVRPVASGLVWFSTTEKKPRGLYKIAYITVYRLQAQIDCQPKKESTVVSKKEQKAQESTVVRDRKSTRLNSSHLVISYAVFCLKKTV